MREYRFNLVVFALAAFLSSVVFAEELPPVPREQWGAHAVTVSHVKGKWIVSGKTNKVILNESDLSMKVQAGHVNWMMGPSLENEIEQSQARATD